MRFVRLLALVLSIVSSGVCLGQANNQTENAQNHSTYSVEVTPEIPNPLPIVVIENQDHAETRERKEKEAEKREKQDLNAQKGMHKATVRMDRATQKMATYSKISTILVGVGTVLLIATLNLTYMANQAAQAAVDVTRKIGEAQTRAYVGVESFCITNIFEDNRPSWHVEIKNFGSSPALDVITDIEFINIVGDFCPHIRDIPNDFINPNQIKLLEGSFPIDIGPRHRELIGTRMDAIQVKVFVRYSDIFGGYYEFTSQYRSIKGTLENGEIKLVNYQD